MKSSTGNAMIDAFDTISTATDNIIGVGNVLMVLADMADSRLDRTTLYMLAGTLMNTSNDIGEAVDVMIESYRTAKA